MAFNREHKSQVEKQISLYADRDSDVTLKVQELNPMTKLKIYPCSAANIS